MTGSWHDPVTCFPDLEWQVICVSLRVCALQRGNTGAATEYQTRLSGVWKKHDANPFTNMLGGLAQAPIFIGFFSAIRAMAAAKVSCQQRL